MEFLKVQEFSDAVGVSVKTLRSWDKDGKLKPDHRTAGGQRMYTQKQVGEYFKKGCSEMGMYQKYPEEKEFLKSGEFAELIGVSASTLRRWDEKGVLKPHHRSPNGQRFYVRKQAEDYFHMAAVKEDGFAGRCTSDDLDDFEIDLFA